MFFKKDLPNTEKNFLVKTCALLIHAAKIDENYTESEEEIIKKTLLELGADKKDISITIQEAKNIEENSNQILDFTKEVKNLPEADKIKIIEALWSIIYSNNDADIYETNLMRRLAGLLYIDSSTMGDIKDRIKKKIVMTYIVNDKCIKCKLTDCVDVCPVDCFYEGKNMLVIKPDECIDCGVCEPECPVDAIKADTEPGSEQWLEINKKYSEIWPNISERKDPPTDHEKFKNEQNKYEKYFKENL